MPAYTPKHKKKTGRKKIFIIISALIVTAIVVTTLTFAWLELDVNSPHSLLTGSVTVTPVVYFVNEDNPDEPISGENFLYENDGEETNYFVVSLTDEKADNYYTKLRISIKFKGVTKSYIRVHLADMGSAVRENENGEEKNYVYLKQNSEFIVDSDVWADNRDYDDYYYFIKDMGYGTNKIQNVPGIIRSEKSSQELEFDFVTSLVNVNKMENGNLYLDITAEAVQFNRIKAFWGMDDLSEFIN